MDTSSNLKDIKVESGYDFFSKLQNSHKENNLELKLLENIALNSIIDISGASQTGKTLLLLDYIKKLILPKTYKNILINGLAQNVLFIDMELKFNIRILVEEIKNYLEDIDITIVINLNDDVENNTNVTKEDIVSEIIHSSLKRFNLIQCYHTGEMLPSIFQSLEDKLIVGKLELDCIIIKNITNYYFEDITVQLLTINKYINKLLNHYILKYIANFNICLMFTRHMQGFIYNNSISHTIQLFDLNYKGIHKALINNKSQSLQPNSNNVYYYKLENDNIIWIDNFDEAIISDSQSNEDDIDL